MSYATSYTMSYSVSYTSYVHLVSRVLSGGLFHWKKGLAYYVVNEGLQLYHDVPENTPLNDVFFYVMSRYHLSSFQNMHEYQVTKNTEIFEFVHTSTPAIPGYCVPEFYKRHGFPKTKAAKEEPEESEDPEVGDVVVVDSGAEVNKSYAISDREDDEDGEGNEGAGAAASDADGEAAAADAAAPDAAAAAAAAAAEAAQA
jgi:hypothetical protein